MEMLSGESHSFKGRSPLFADINYTTRCNDLIDHVSSIIGYMYMYVRQYIKSFIIYVAFYYLLNVRMTNINLSFYIITSADTLNISV